MLLVLALVAQAWSGAGTSLLCRMNGLRQAHCCCPQDEAQKADVAVVRAGTCCDVVQGTDGDQAAAVVDSMRASGPERSWSSWAIPPRGPTDVLLVQWQLFDLTRAAGPPGQLPVYLSTKHLLI